MRSDRPSRLALRIAGDGRGGLERGPTGENREAGEEPLLVGIEQVIAPGDGVAHRLLARGEIARPALEDVQPAVEPSQQRIWREQTDARGGKLDGQRQAVQPRTDLDHGRGIVGRDLEAGLDRLRAIDEEANRICTPDLVDRGGCFFGARVVVCQSRRNLRQRQRR